MLNAIELIAPFIVGYNHLIQLIFQIGLGVLLYLFLISSFIFLLRNNVKEYQFVWKTFYLSVFNK